MAIADRNVTTVWDGTLEKGVGTFVDSSSTVLDDEQVTWASRTEAPQGKSSPEELLAAAHSSCFSMALAMGLGNNGTPPTRLDVSCEVSLEEVDGAPTITTSKLVVRAQVDGLSEEDFQGVVSEAETGCPVSRLFAGAEVTVDAELTN